MNSFQTAFASMFPLQPGFDAAREELAYLFTRGSLPSTQELEHVQQKYTYIQNNPDLFREMLIVTKKYEDQFLIQRIVETCSPAMRISMLVDCATTKDFSKCQTLADILLKNYGHHISKIVVRCLRDAAAIGNVGAINFFSQHMIGQDDCLRIFGDACQNSQFEAIQQLVRIYPSILNRSKACRYEDYCINQTVRQLLNEMFQINLRPCNDSHRCYSFA